MPTPMLGRILPDELRQTSRHLAELADRLSSKRDEKPLAIDAFFALTPKGARLWASQAYDGQWWSYLTMPPGWAPADDRPRWIFNEPQGHYWNTFAGETEDECLRKALTRLLETS